MKIKPIKIFSAVFAVGIAVALWQIGAIVFERKNAENLYDGVIEQALILPSTSSYDEAEVPGTPAETRLPTVDFSALGEISDEVVGWVYCPESPINYPVMQGEDNQKYVDTLPNGNKNGAGSIFADYRMAPFENENYYIVYGHNMKNDTMFGALSDYRKQAYYDAHPAFYYFTESGTVKIELYAGFSTTADSDVYTVGRGDGELANFMTDAKLRSTFNSPAEYKTGDRVVAFSTCVSGKSDDLARYVLLGIVKPIE